MNGDIHTCGTCKQQFSTIESFLEHKNEKCGSPVDDRNAHHELQSPISLNMGLGSPISLNMGLGVETSVQQQNDVSNLRARLMGLAAAAQAESLIQSTSPETHHPFRPTVQKSPYHDDEEDVADVLANQLSGMVSAQMLDYESTLHAETHVATEQLPQEIEMEKDISKVGKEDIEKGMKKPPTKTKEKSEHKTFKCLYIGCNFEGRYLKDLTRHTRIHTGERPFDCELCGHTFSRADKLKLHLRIHSGEKPFKCQSCSYAAVDRSSLRKHIRTHTNERPCVCQICPYRAKDTSQLVVHLRSHTGDTPFVCLAPNCEAAFKTSSDLKRHTRLHTDEKPFSCDSCIFRTRIKGNLLAHMRRVHLGGKKKYSCTLCNAFVAPTHSLLMQHKKTHSNVLLRCNIGKCDYVGVNVTAMRYHLRSKHPGECPLLSCKHCSFTCSQNSEMRVHMKSEHTEIFEKQKRKSKKHSTSRTTKNSKSSSFKSLFKCTLCSLSFVREDSLRSHVRVHERAKSGQKGVVVVDTSGKLPDDDPEATSTSECVASSTIVPMTISDKSPQQESAPVETTPQQVVFYVPNILHSEPQDPLLLSPNSGNNLLEQLNLQHGVQYILVPSTAQTLDTQSHMYQQ